MDNTSIEIYGNMTNYEFTYELDVDHKFTSGLGNAASINDDEDYRMDTGDILYACDVNEDEDQPESVVIGLASDDEIELTLRVE